MTLWFANNSTIETIFPRLCCHVPMPTLPLSAPAESALSDVSAQGTKPLKKKIWDACVCITYNITYFKKKKKKNVAKWFYFLV